MKQTEEWRDNARDDRTQQHLLPTQHATAVSAKATFNERHYSVAEVAALWNLSADAVRRLFEHEPGVLVLGGESRSRYKRRYTTLRIPESVVARVHKRMATV